MKKLHALLLSLLLPGLGQAYIGETARAIATLSMSLSLWAAAAFMYVWQKSDIMSIVFSLGWVYLLVLVPAAREAWQHADADTIGPARGESRYYVLTMLGCLGPMALPLLWQNPRFGRPAKIALTTLVLGVLVGGLWILVRIGPALDETLKELRAIDSLQLSPR